MINVKDFQIREDLSQEGKHFLIIKIKSMKETPSKFRYVSLRSLRHIYEYVLINITMLNGWQYRNGNIYY